MTRVASFHLARYPRRLVPFLLGRVPLDRRSLAATDGLVLGKLLGTGRGESMALAADTARWAIFAVWEDEAALDAFTAGSPLVRRLARAEESWSVRLAPIGARGRWSGVDLSSPTSGGGDEPVAVLTRARIRLRALPSFYRAVPEVDAELKGRAGLLASVGVGEWPVALQGTFSLWSSETAMRAFAYGGPDHQTVMRRTRRERWYAEELFARYRPYASSGTWNGVDPLTAAG